MKNCNKKIYALWLTVKYFHVSRQKGLNLLAVNCGLRLTHRLHSCTSLGIHVQLTEVRSVRCWLQGLRLVLLFQHHVVWSGRVLYPKNFGGPGVGSIHKMLVTFQAFTWNENILTLTIKLLCCPVPFVAFLCSIPHRSVTNLTTHYKLLTSAIALHSFLWHFGVCNSDILVELPTLKVIHLKRTKI